MNMGSKGAIQTALVHLLEEGSIALPVVLFTEYKRVGLTEQEVMLLIHLMIFLEKEQNPLPTMEQLAERMNLSVEEIMCALQKLVRGGFLSIEEEIDENGVLCERYSTAPLLQQLVASFIEREGERDSAGEQSYQNLFHLFEQELGRPLSPLECENLVRWIDEDGYSEELILAALREAVFCSKPSIRYIDKILLEWQRNGIKTAEEAAEYSRKFRQKGMLYQAPEQQKRSNSHFSFYNWVNQES